MSKCKYYLEKEVVSYDGGITWNETGVTRKGNLYEEGSEECIDPSVQYRWINMNVTTDWICDETNKYYKQKKQVSYDGITWEDVSPAEYQRGNIYEINSPDCQPKLQATYSNGQTYYYLVCDGNTTLTSGDTKPEGYEYSRMTSAVIGDCVTSLDDWVFHHCSSLTSVTIPDSVTTIDVYALEACRSLTSIGLKGSDASVEIPSGVTTLSEGLFYNCSGLTGATIPNSVTSIGDWAFANCSGLTSIDIPNSVTTLSEGLFSNCIGLTGITIPNSITTIGSHVFRRCTSLTSMDIPDSVTSIGDYAFAGCSGLTSIDIPNSVTSIGHNTFEDCGGLASATIGSGVTSIDYNVFYNCTGLQSITVLATTPPTLGKRAFDGSTCPIYVPASSVETYKTASGWKTYASRIQAIP